MKINDDNNNNNINNSYKIVSGNLPNIFKDKPVVLTLAKLSSVPQILSSTSSSSLPSTNLFLKKKRKQVLTDRNAVEDIAIFESKKKKW